MSSPGKQLMDLIAKHRLQKFDYGTEETVWRKDAEAKINELLRPIIAHERMSALELAAERELKAQEAVDARKGKPDGAD